MKGQVGKGIGTHRGSWQGRESRLLLLALLVGASCSGWLPTLWAQGIEPGNRVGITLLGHRLWVHWRACSTIRELGPPAGTDGLVLSGPDLCDRTAWWQVAWSNGQQGWCAECRMTTPSCRFPPACRGNQVGAWHGSPRFAMGTLRRGAIHKLWTRSWY